MARENKFLDDMRLAVVAQSARGRLLDIGVTMRKVNSANGRVSYSHFLLIKKEVYTLERFETTDNNFYITARNNEDYGHRAEYSTPQKASVAYYEKICREQNDKDYKVIKATFFVFPNKFVNFEDVSEFWDQYLQNDRLVNGDVSLKYSLNLPGLLILSHTKNEIHQVRRAKPNPWLLSYTITRQLEYIYGNDVVSKLALSHPMATTQDKVVYGLLSMTNHLS